MRVNLFLGVLGELLQRMDLPETVYGPALPAHRHFARLQSRLSAWDPRAAEPVLLLGSPSLSACEVGLVSSNGGTAPTRCQSAESTASTPTLKTETR